MIDIKAALEKKEEAERAAAEAALLPQQRPETVSARDADLPAITSLKGWQRDVMNARLRLFEEFTRLEAALGTNKAVAEFIRLAEKGGFPPHVQALFSVANARSGKDGKMTISRGTLMNWKRMALLGQAAFAPAATERVLADPEREPAWVPYFRDRP